ncbi:AfsR/SARP family transcriptional regulator [Nonomuraea sp. PA05]|uniref:AfsR/SARP family transcriptional regulator n=1 Tax=Nonomuraea sp. PA05 TaxID=2604466 RepID=UPI0011DA7854|nr:BTAD domain-containing putative transcriptional regulator [Nonomuraea sp. PA05]TYB58876.1 AfsR/SARP family transcriptional regulator [Nonomuraea sp. PA05]
MRVGILGPLRVAGGEIGGARVRALLVRLALDPGRVVTADRLIGDLWPGDSPAHPMAALQSLVSRARREAPGLISSHPAGYLLDVPPGEVDAWAFERLVREGDVRAALALWRGPALADAAGLPFAAGPAARLEELRLTAPATRLTDDLDRNAAGMAAEREGRTSEMAPNPTGRTSKMAPGPEGRASETAAERRGVVVAEREGLVGEVVAELEGLVAAYPLREPFHALLVRALTAQGRRAEALALFERIRTALATELGTDPGPELRQAHLEALRDDAEPPAPRSNLPARLTRFVGRREDLDRVRGSLAEARLVTLVGPGGAGKTRLALEAAAGLAVRDGVWLVELASAASVRAAVEGVLKATDLVAALRGTAPLIVLDNCEHLIEQAARVARWLLSEVAGLRVLATSREPLDIPGERLHQVLPLPAGPAAELFADRAAAARPDLVVTRAEAERICRELDGIPLAIELAAARLRTMPMSVLVEQLGDRLTFRGGRTSEPRHRTLRAVFDWSWNLLSERERELLRGLTVFSGGATYEAVSRVCGGDPDLLSSLVDKSLIAVSGDRYTMLETIRQYAAADLPELRREHARYYTELAEKAEPHLRTGAQLAWLAVLDAERDNLDAALHRSDDPLRLILPRLLSWIVRGRWREMTEQAAAVLARVGAAAPPGRELAHGLCVVLTGGGVSRVVRESDHPAALNAYLLGGSLTTPAEAVELAERAVARLRDHPDVWTRSAALLAAGVTRFEYGAVAGAEDLLEPALAGFRETGDRWGQWASLYWLSLVAENRGDFAAAVALGEEPERLAAELSGLETPLGPMTFLLRLGQLKGRAGDREGAARALDRAWAAAERCEDQDMIARVLHARAELARRGGDPGEAARLLGLAMALGVETTPQFGALLRVELARVSESPAAPLRRALELMAGCSDRTVRAAVLEGVAEHLAPLPAAELLGAARGLRGVRESADPHVNGLVDRCVRALGADVCQAALARGATLPEPEKYALGRLAPA